MYMLLFLINSPKVGHEGELPVKSYKTTFQKMLIFQNHRNVHF